jgi:hypothetical protein
MQTEPIEGTLTVTGNQLINYGLQFKLSTGEEILRVDEKGMTYKGVRIEDAGEAHRAFIEAMGRMNSSKSTI